MIELILDEEIKSRVRGRLLVPASTTGQKSAVPPQSSEGSQRELEV